MASASGLSRRNGAPKWMVTFADLMALLVALFVMILSFAEIDSDSFRRNAGPISEAFHSKNIIQISSPVSPLAKTRTFKLDLKIDDNAKDKSYLREAARNKLLKRLESVMAAEIAGRLIELETKDGVIIIRFPDNSAFPSGSDQLARQIMPVLDRISGILARAEGKILVAGHTDDTPISTRRFRSNWDLSASRAVSVVHQLLLNSAVEPARVTAQGFADNQPLTANDTPAGRARNRRVEILIEISAPDPAPLRPKPILSR